MSENAIEVKNISKIFQINKKHNFFKKFNKINSKNPQTITALKDISFTATKGEVLGIMGLNGSGKSTLLQIIAGLYRPNSGSVKVNGTLAPILQLGTGFQPELGPRDNIMNYGMLMGLTKNEIKNRIDKIIEFAELEKFSKMKLKNFSTGMRARLAFSTILQINPDILLIDEVLAVGDIKFKEKSYAAFSSFKEKGKTILITSHNTFTLNNICDRILLINKGKMISIGKPKEVIEKYREIVNKNN